MQTKINFQKPEKTVQKSLMRTASKTVRKFTRLDASETMPSACLVAVDWFDFTAHANIPEPEPGKIAYWYADNLVLEYQQKGTPVYQHTYHAILDGEIVANVHTHTRNEKIIKPGLVKIEILNHLFLTDWLSVKNYLMDKLHIGEVKTYSNLHISIDGCEHVYKFLNIYANQLSPGGRTPIGRGKSVKFKGRANFDAKRKDRKTGMYQNFKIGTGHKYLTVYNKTSELEKSHKEYIREGWRRNGMDVEATQWRCELRMKSQAIKEIKDFDVTRLTDPNYLLAIFRTQIKNFFEFVVVDRDSNVSRCSIIDMFQFEKLRVVILDKIPRPIVRGAYKAKMAIHNIVKDVQLKFIKAEDDIIHALNHLRTSIDLYDLHRWYQRKLPEWMETYQSFVRGDGSVQLQLGESVVNWQYYGK